MKCLTMLVLSGCVLFAGGCTNRPNVIPEYLEGVVDRNLRYATIQPNPESYQGLFVLAGGQVLSAEQVKDGMAFEVLQIPLSNDLIPAGREAESKGRFVVFDRHARLSDPDIFSNKKRITIVGNMRGTTNVKDDQVPLLALEHVTVWELDDVNARYWPYCGFGDPERWGYYGYMC